MPFIVKFGLMLVALVMSVFYAVPVLIGSLILLVALLFRPQPVRGLADLVFPDGLSEAIMTFVVVCASGVSLAVQLLS